MTCFRYNSLWSTDNVTYRQSIYRPAWLGPAPGSNFAIGKFVGDFTELFAVVLAGNKNTNNLTHSKCGITSEFQGTQPIFHRNKTLINSILLLKITSGAKCLLFSYFQRNKPIKPNLQNIYLWPTLKTSLSDQRGESSSVNRKWYNLMIKMMIDTEKVRRL